MAPFNRFSGAIENPKSDDAQTGSLRARESERERERDRSLGISAWARNPLTMAPLNGDLSADSGALMLTVRRPLTKSTMPRQP